MLRHQITWVLLAEHFEEFEVAGLESLLRVFPNPRRLQMPRAAVESV